MTTKKTIIFLLSTLFFGVLIGIVGYYYFSQYSVAPNQNQKNEEVVNIAEVARAKAELARIKELEEHFPDVVNGIINLSSESPTLKTNDGKEYFLWPVFSVVDYQRNDYKDGQAVELRGKILLRDEKNGITEDRLFIALTEVLPK